MVEGHSVHRVAAFHRTKLVGKAFKATSPNGRFKEGAKAINGEIFHRIEAVGKNLFAFFGSKPVVVVHIHFGMAGAWALYEGEEAPPPTDTNRLRLQGHNIVADLSAMTVQHGGIELYEKKRAKLGEDPLREDADPERLWNKVQKSKKSIGALIMDQSFFTGPGNIYRAEILFKASVHPDIPGNKLAREQFDRVWYHTVSLLQRGFQTGSILTVDPEEAAALGGRRRYIYNSSSCPRCSSAIRMWSINSRTCYACPTCQPRTIAAATPEQVCVPFNSHCARESVATRLQEPHRLTVKEIKEELSKRDQAIPAGYKKNDLVALLQDRLRGEPDIPLVSSEAAAAEKAAAGESLAVEHIAELAPGQARRARAASKRTRSVKKELMFNETKSTKRSRRERTTRASASTKQLSESVKVKQKVSFSSAANDDRETCISVVQTTTTESKQTPKRNTRGRMKSKVTP